MGRTERFSYSFKGCREGPDWYLAEVSDPASEEDMEMVKKDPIWGNGKRSSIYAVKENEDAPDERAFLLICFVFTSDFYGADTWYRFDPDGGITKFDFDLPHLDGP